MPQKTSIHNLLIMAPAHAGDMVMANTLFKVIKEHAPHIIIDVVAPQSTLSLLSFMPEVNNVFTLLCPHKKLKFWTRYQLAQKLKSKHYDAAILLQNSFKSALIPFWARIPKRIGYAKECRAFLLTHFYPFNKKKSRSYLEQQLLLLKYIGIFVSERTSTPFPHLRVTEEQRNTVRHQFNLTTQERPILILCPGAQYGPSKQWPANYFAQIAQRKIDQGWQVWILGAQWDQTIAHEIDQKVRGSIKNFSGNTTLTEAVILMSFAHHVITNDSGLMHIAAALDKKIIALYGSSSPIYTPPLTQQATIMSLQLPCSPCFKKTCPFGHYDCLKKLTPNMLPDL